jgi:hypothetical protein
MGISTIYSNLTGNNALASSRIFIPFANVSKTIEECIFSA